MAAGVALHLFTLLIAIIGVDGWRCAKYKHYFSQQPDYIECVWDCCGNSFNRHCCAPIGIIVGICIVGAVVVAGLVVLLACWWQRRRSSHGRGPRLFHNRKHSHYPVAPSSVTRPAPLMPYRGGPNDGEGQIYKPQGYRPPPSAHRPRGPPPDRGDPEKKVPPTDFYEPGEERKMPPPQGYRQGPPPQGYRNGPPPQGQRYRDDPPPERYRDDPPTERYRDGPPPQRYRDDPPPRRYRDDPHSEPYRDEPPQRYREEPPRDHRQGPPPNRPPVQEYFD